jgi:CubicO group peptidase (beta-lactamase class C family)
LLLTSCYVKPGRGLNNKTTDINNLDEEIEAFMSKWKIKGGTIALVKDDKLIYSNAYGSTLDNAPMTKFSGLRIASLSKPITAIAVMKLVEQGKLSLDSKVFGNEGILNDSTYLKIFDSRAYEITVRQLLQHTAGWDRDVSPEGDPMFNSANIGKAMGKVGYAVKNTIIQYMLTKTLDFDPGTRYAYSNLGYNILGRVIEKTSGMNYEDFVRKHIFLPLDMKHMQLAKNDEPHASLLPWTFDIEAMDSHGGWKASSTDLAKILASMVPGSKYQILETESIAEMLKGSDVNPSYGLGWCVNAKGNCWHTGSLNECSTFMARLKTGVCAVLVFNGRPDDPDYFAELDKLVWNGLKKVKVLPTKDRFIEDKIAFKLQPEGASPSITFARP